MEFRDLLYRHNGTQVIKRITALLRPNHLLCPCGVPTPQTFIHRTSFRSLFFLKSHFWVWVFQVFEVVLSFGKFYLGSRSGDLFVGLIRSSPAMCRPPPEGCYPEEETLSFLLYGEVLPKFYSNQVIYFITLLSILYIHRFDLLGVQR